MLLVSAVLLARCFAKVQVEAIFPAQAEPVLSFTDNTSEFMFAYNPSYVDLSPTLVHGGMVGALVVRVQDLKQGRLVLLSASKSHAQK